MPVQKEPLITHKRDTMQNKQAHLSWKVPQQHTLNRNSEQEEMFKAIKKKKKKKEGLN